MTQEEKLLLLKDLCSRLPYGVKGVLCDDCTCTLDRIWTKKGYESVIIAGDYYDIEDFKPYLFPLSSMNEEQRKEYESLCIKETSECADLCGIFFTKDYYYDTVESIDWLNKNHFDYRGLISMGLANDATGLNIY